MEQPDAARLTKLLNDMQSELDELRAEMASERARNRGAELCLGEIMGGIAGVAEMICRNSTNIRRESCATDLELLAERVSKERPTTAATLRFAAVQIRSIDSPKAGV